MNDRSRHVLWIVAGLYVCYLGFGLVKGFVTDTSNSSLMFMLVGILFLVAGAVLAVLGLKGMMQKGTEQDDVSDDTADNPEIEELDADETEEGSVEETESSENDK